MSQSLLERFVAQLNANVFFAEFAFASAQLRIPGTGDVELADHLVLLDDLRLIFQLKERNRDAPASVEALNAWFDNKVTKKAVKQINNTRLLLDRHAGSNILNHRGEPVRLPSSDPSRSAAVVIYRAPPTVGFLPPRHYVSRSAGFVHLIRADDYFEVCQALVTPTEVVDYLAFRERAVSGLAFAPDAVSEAALVGQFMAGDFTAIPHERYAGALDALVDNRHEWDLSFLTDRLGQQITHSEGGDPDTSHHRILAELGKLTRAELRELKTRLQFTLEAVAADEMRRPYRFAVPRTSCGFLLFPVTSELRENARTALQNYSFASKHELQVAKHVGLSVRKSGDYIDIEWMYLESPPGPNPEVDELLAANYPFRPMRETTAPRYQFRSDDLREAIGDHG